MKKFWFIGDDMKVQQCNDIDFLPIKDVCFFQEVIIVIKDRWCVQ